MSLKSWAALGLWAALAYALLGKPVRQFLADSHTTGQVDLMARPATIGPGGAWSWFADPRAVYYNGTTYSGYVTPAGDIVAVAVGDDGSHETFTLKAALQYDDHANPVFRVRSDGKIQAFYSAHNGGDIFHRTTTNAEDISAWGTEQTEDGDSALMVTYPNPIDYAAKLILHWRRTGGAQSDLVFAESADNGATFGTLKSMFTGDTGEIAYMKCAKHPSSDRIDFVVTNGHPDQTLTSVYHFYRSGENFYESDGTLIAAVGDLTTSTGDAITPADATLVWDGSTLGDSWIWDITHDGSGNPVILLSKVPGATSHEMHHAVWSGSAWDVNKIADVGGSLVPPAASDDQYSAGGALDPADPTRVFIAIEDGGVSDIYQYDTSDGGDTWVQGTRITRDYTKNVRPYVPRNAGARIEVLWFRGRYDDFTDYSTAIMGWGAPPVTGAGTLTLDTDGEVFTAVANSADHPFDIGDWESQAASTGEAVDTDDGSLTHKGTGVSGWHYLRCAASTSRSERMVQAVQRAQPGLVGLVWGTHGGHFETGAGGDQFCGIQFSIARSTDQVAAIEKQANTSLASGVSNVAAKRVGDYYRGTAHLNGTAVAVHDFASGASQSATATTFSSGYSGIGGNDTDELQCYEFFDCTARDLLVTGLETGDVAQLRNSLGVVLAEETESGGTATFDMTEVVIPEVADIVVRDSGGTLLGGLTLAGSGGPKEYARGGCAYSFTAAEEPEPSSGMPPLSLAPLGLAPLSLSPLGLRALGTASE